MSSSKVRFSIKAKYVMLNIYRMFLYFFNFLSNSCSKVYHFFLFMYLSALYSKRFKETDVKVLQELNELNTETFGKWSGQLPYDVRTALLSMALDPKSAGYKGRAAPQWYSFRRRDSNTMLKSMLNNVDAQIKEIKNLDEQIKKENAVTATRAAESKADVKTRITDKINNDHQMSPEVKAQLFKQIEDHQMSPEVKAQLFKQIEEALMMEPKDLENKK